MKDLSSPWSWKVGHFVILIFLDTLCTALCMWFSRHIVYSFVVCVFLTTLYYTAKWCFFLATLHTAFWMCFSVHTVCSFVVCAFLNTLSTALCCHVFSLFYHQLMRWSGLLAMQLNFCIIHTLKPNFIFSSLNLFMCMRMTRQSCHWELLWRSNLGLAENIWFWPMLFLSVLFFSTMNTSLLVVVLNCYSQWWKDQ